MTRVRRDAYADETEELKVQMAEHQLTLKTVTKQIDGLAVCLQEIQGMPEDIKRLKSFEIFVGEKKKRLDLYRYQRDLLIQRMDSAQQYIKVLGEELQSLSEEIDAASIAGGEELQSLSEKIDAAIAAGGEDGSDT